MKKLSSERLDHALHNEKVCDYLNLKPEFRDWIITTAFYSSLHFVSHKIFPLAIKSTSGKDVKIIDINQYVNVIKSDLGKHEALKDLAEKYCPEISPDYARLLSLSYTARYLSYQHSPEIANMARRLMDKIKKYCTK